MRGRFLNGFPQAQSNKPLIRNSCNQKVRVHILTLTTLFPNSLQPVHAVFVRTRMEALVKKYGHDWTVVAPVPYFPKLPFRFKSLYDTYAHIPTFENPWGYPIHHPRYLVTPKIGMRYYGDWMSKGIMQTVQEINRKKRIDIIDGHFVYPDGSAAVKIGKKLGIPVVLSARGTDLNYYPQIRPIVPLLKENLSSCNHLICVCSDLKEVALTLGLSASKVSVIGNGVDASLFHPGDQNAERQKLGLPLGKKIILSVGHLTERKGFHLLIKALKKCSDRETILVLAGNGPDRKELERLTVSLGIENRVIFTGSVLNKDLPSWYRAADIFALASSREGWPNVVCEAQACGLPVVATKVWGIPEIVKNASLGILIEERAVAPLARALQSALDTDWDKAAIALEGASRTWDTVAAQVETVFRGVMGA